MTWLGVPINISTTSNTTTTTVGNCNYNWNTLYSNTSTPLTLNTIPPAAIEIRDPSTHLPSLTIHHDGRIEYKGKPSQAAEAFYKALGANINIKSAGEQALAKTYRRAIERCLRQAKSMSHEDFIAMLENEIETRTAKAAWMVLSEGDAEEDSNA